MKLTMKQAGEDGYPERQPIPNNSYFEAVVLDITEQESLWDIDENDPSKGKKKQLSWKFKIIDPGGEFDNRYVWGTTSMFFSTSPQNKLRQWIQAVLNIPVLPEGYAVDTEELHNKQCLIIVGAKEKRAGGISNRVTEVQPSRAAAPLSGVTADASEASGDPDYDAEEPFRIDAGEWAPGHWGSFPERMLP